MSKNQVLISGILLRDHFGDLIEKVGELLLNDGWTPFPLIVLRSKLTIGQVKQCLQVMIQHGLVTFKCDDRGAVEFRCNVDNILLLARFPFYIHSAKSLYGDISELIIEEILANGQLSFSACVKRVFSLVESLNLCQKPEELKERFSTLAQSNFVRRCPEVVDETIVGPDGIAANSGIPNFREYSDPFLLPNAVNIKRTEASTSAAKGTKRKLDDSSEGGESADPDSSILWRVNFDRFHQFARDKLILKMVGNMIDEKAVEVMRGFLRLSELRSNSDSPKSQSLSLNEAIKLIPDSAGLVQAQVEQYVILLRDDSSKIFRKVGESGGGLYEIDFSNASVLMAQSAIEDLVREKLGSKALRIFRLLTIKGFLEQNELEKMAMLPSKEGKELTYKLLAEGFIAVKEVPKTNDFAPSRTFYLFHVNLPRVIRKLIDDSYKFLANLVLRREHEFAENSALLDRQERLDAVVANIQRDPNLDEETKAQHVADVEEAYVSVAEKEKLVAYRRTLAKIQQAEIEIDQSLLVFQLYLKYLQPVVISTGKKRNRTAPLI